ncbi:MAG: hypothetical protein ABII88_10545 [Candidatus Omnitrophota bacterium]
MRIQRVTRKIQDVLRGDFVLYSLKKEGIVKVIWLTVVTYIIFSLMIILGK